MFSLRDINSDSLLIGLKSTKQLFAQTEILVRQTAAVTGFSTIIKRLVSSANRQMLESRFLRLSLMQIKKK